MTIPADRDEPQVDPNLQPLIAAAIADLGARLGIGREAIRVVSARALTWPNGALGCPQPGMAYADMLVEGTQVVLDAQGRQWSYHSGGSTPPFLCEPTTSARVGKRTPRRTLGLQGWESPAD